MSGPEPQVAGTEIADSILDLIGNTPMVKLPRLSESQGLVATIGHDNKVTVEVQR